MVIDIKFKYIMYNNLSYILKEINNLNLFKEYYIINTEIIDNDTKNYSLKNNQIYIFH